MVMAKSEKRARAAILAWASLDAETLRLIRLANVDLHSGPIGHDDDDGASWPGFEAACALIRDALPSVELWLDTQSDFVRDSEPNWYAPGCDVDDDEIRENPEDWVHYDTNDVKRAIVGIELLPYV